MASQILLPKRVSLSKSPPQDVVVCGIDVSHHQATINWDAVAAMTRYDLLARQPAGRGTTVGKTQGTIGITPPKTEEEFALASIAGQEVIRFAIVRAFDGEKPDRMFDRNWKQAYKVDLLRGVYQYFRPGKGRAIEQASILLEAVDKAGGLQPDVDLAPILDFETLDGCEPARAIDEALAWADHIRSQLGVCPILYTYPSFWSSNRLCCCSEMALWIAHYRGDDKPGAQRGAELPPLIPSEQWSNWVLWQHSCRGQIDGIGGDVDLNVFNGSLSDMLRFISLTWDRKPWPNFFEPPSDELPTPKLPDEPAMDARDDAQAPDPMPVVFDVEPFGPEAPTLPSRKVETIEVKRRKTCWDWFLRLVGVVKQ